MIYVAIFAEGDFDKLVALPQEQVVGYTLGVCDGAALYGAGAIRTYVIPDELESMQQKESPGEVARALAAYRREFGGS